MSSTGFTQQQKHVVLERDNHQCPMCMARADTVNHRANRGAGGFRAGNVLSNACAICHSCNGLIESEPELQALAVQLGVKISRYEDPALVPYLHPVFGWVLLEADGGFSLLPHNSKWTTNHSS